MQKAFQGHQTLPDIEAANRKLPNGEPWKRPLTPRGKRKPKKGPSEPIKGGKKVPVYFLLQLLFLPPSSIQGIWTLSTVLKEFSVGSAVFCSYLPWSRPLHLACKLCTFIVVVVVVVFPFLSLFFFGRAHMAILRTYSWHCTQGPRLEGSGTLWDAEEQVKVGCVQNKCPTDCAIILALVLLFVCVFARLANDILG